MADKSKSKTPKGKKEKGAFRKKSSEKTAYQLEREKEQNRKKRNGNYAL